MPAPDAPGRLSERSRTPWVWWWAALGVLLLAFIASLSDAQPPDKRVALVIGNGAYPASPLKNPVNDARATAAALKGLGFDGYPDWAREVEVAANRRTEVAIDLQPLATVSAAPTPSQSGSPSPGVPSRSRWIRRTLAPRAVLRSDRGDHYEYLIEYLELQNPSTSIRGYPDGPLYAMRPVVRYLHANFTGVRPDDASGCSNRGRWRNRVSGKEARRHRTTHVS